MKQRKKDLNESESYRTENAPMGGKWRRFGILILEKGEETLAAVERRRRRDERGFFIYFLEL